MISDMYSVALGSINVCLLHYCSPIHIGKLTSKTTEYPSDFYYSLLDSLAVVALSLVKKCIHLVANKF